MSETKRYTAPVTVMLTPTMKEQVERIAQQRGIPTSTLLRIIITEWIAGVPQQ